MNEQITREQFMEFFRNDDLINTLSTDDRIELFSSILAGSSDFKLELFEQLFADYGVNHLAVVQVEKHKQ
ncbi:MAG: hypothetical protein E6Q38_03920 [Crocinitomicaceae bacterium]|nr:MAG: hypothetical protein E6Q38_03920 [Crocinitomicaceae bacterium]